jgi:hypothetical protein
MKITAAEILGGFSFFAVDVVSVVALLLTMA